MHLFGKFHKRNKKENKLSLIKPCETAKFWTFSKFHETGPKCRSTSIHLCGKFGKRNNNYKLVRKGNKLFLIKPCKTAKFWTFTEFHETWPKRSFRPMHLCGKFAIRTNNYKLVWKTNKHSLIKPCKITKFWTFSKFHETWIKRWSKPMHMCGKFGKRNNNYKLVRKENKLSFIKQCKTAKFT